MEDQLRVTPQKVAEIRSQLVGHEVSMRILGLMDFKTIATDASTWKQLVDGLTSPT